MRSTTHAKFLESISHSAIISHSVTDSFPQSLADSLAYSLLIDQAFHPSTHSLICPSVTNCWMIRGGLTPILQCAASFQPCLSCQTVSIATITSAPEWHCLSFAQSLGLGKERAFFACPILPFICQLASPSRSPFLCPVVGQLACFFVPLNAARQTISLIVLPNPLCRFW